MALAVDSELTCEGLHLDLGTATSLRAALISGPAVASLAETFKVLGDPTRVRILDVLSKAELCVCDIATILGTSESAVSHQLRLLRSLRLVRARRDGRLIYYALDDQHIVTLFQEGLRHVQEAGEPDRTDTR